MNFEEAMAFVERDHAFPARREDRHAERFARLLATTGLDRALAKIPVVVVAGSAGKGSIARMVAAIARALLDDAGDRRPVVLGTKPPLHETDDGHRERYQVLEPGEAPAWISRAAFAEHVSALVPHVRAPSSLGAFAPYDLRYAVLARLAVERGAALLVVEANVGLRDDVAARFPGQVANVLGRIGEDHVGWLVPPKPLPPELAGLGRRAGPTWHKASGLARGVPVFVGLQDDDVLVAIRALAAKAGAGPLHVLGEDFDGRALRTSIDGTDARFSGRDARSAYAFEARIGPLGLYQVDNAAVAVATAFALRARLRDADERTFASAVARALPTVRTPGRLDRIAGTPPTFLNVTESSMKAASMLASLRALVATRWVACVSVIARVEDARATVERIAAAPEVRLLVATGGGAREGDQVAVPAEEVAAWARATRPDLEVVAIDDPGAAIEAARARAEPDEIVLLVGDAVAHAVDVPRGPSRGGAPSTQ